MKTSYFEFGEVYTTTQVNTLLTDEEKLKLLTWHGQLKGGELCRADQEANRYALKHQLRILSRFFLNGQSYYVITEADRSYTTIMLIEEY